MDVPRRLVDVAWVVARTGLAEATVYAYAAQGRLPGATRLGSRWRFDPDVIEDWIQAGMTKPQQTTVSPTPKAEPQRSRGTPLNLPPLRVLCKGAAHRGINDLPTERQERQAGRRRGRTARAALSAN